MFWNDSSKFVMRSLYFWLLRKKSTHPEVCVFGWWLKVAFIIDTMAIDNETLTRLQGDQNKIVTKMMSIVFSQEEKFSIYIEELSNNDFSLSSFSSVQSLFEENPDERNERCFCFDKTPYRSEKTK